LRHLQTIVDPSKLPFWRREQLGLLTPEEEKRLEREKREEDAYEVFGTEKEPGWYEMLSGAAKKKFGEWIYSPEKPGEEPSELELTKEKIKKTKMKIEKVEKQKMEEIAKARELQTEEEYLLHSKRYLANVKKGLGATRNEHIMIDFIHAVEFSIERICDFEYQNAKQADKNGFLEDFERVNRGFFIHQDKQSSFCDKSGVKPGNKLLSIIKMINFKNIRLTGVKRKRFTDKELDDFFLIKSYMDYIHQQKYARFDEWFFYVDMIKGKLRTVQNTILKMRDIKYWSNVVFKPYEKLGNKIFLTPIPKGQLKLFQYKKTINIVKYNFRKSLEKIINRHISETMPLNSIRREEHLWKRIGHYSIFGVYDICHMINYFPIQGCRELQEDEYYEVTNASFMMWFLINKRPISGSRKFTKEVLESLKDDPKIKITLPYPDLSSPYFFKGRSTLLQAPRSLVRKNFISGYAKASYNEMANFRDFKKLLDEFYEHIAIKIMENSKKYRKTYENDEDIMKTVEKVAYIVRKINMRKKRR